MPGGFPEGTLLEVHAPGQRAYDDAEDEDADVLALLSPLVP